MSRQKPEALNVRASLVPRVTELAGAKLDARLAGARFGVLPERLRRQGVGGVLVLDVEEGSRAFANGLRAGLHPVSQGWCRGHSRWTGSPWLPADAGAGGFRPCIPQGPRGPNAPAG